MPDYDSTARALALHVSPPRSPNSSPHSQHPWSSRRRGSSSLNRSNNARRSNNNNNGFLSKTIGTAENSWRRLHKTVEKMTPVQMAASVIVGVATVVFTVLFLIYSDQIFSWLKPIAEKWKSLRGGWLILWAMIFVTAFPPMIGYATCLTLAGFVYGFPGGWPIVASANIVGSTVSFILCRTLFSGFVNRYVANDRRFEALSLVLKHDGLKLLVMIRLCPLPYSISNAGISTFPTVTPLPFALATAAATPKLFIAVFIGSRLAAIAKNGEKMDTTTKAINWASIIIGIGLGVLTGWLIYKRTLDRSRQIEAEERVKSRQPGTQSGEFSDDAEEQTATATLIGDDQIDFLDTEGAAEDYHDEFTDDDASKYGDEDEEGAIGLHRQHS